MRFAFADPPYFTQGKKLYGEHHPDAAIWDKEETHIELLRRLTADYPEGWALACNPANLRWLLPNAPETTRVCAWTKTFHQIRPTTVQFAWEPVLLYGGRKENKRKPMVRDWYSGVPTRLKGLPGAKSDAYNDWILQLLNFQAGDELDDLFPGTAGMQRAKERLSMGTQVAWER
jgi:hypothetical protein